MALVIADRVRETTASIGTGTLTLGGPYSGFQAFSVLGNGNTTYYAVIDPTTGNWEVGIGTYTLSGNTLSRDTVLSSSNSDLLVPFGAGVKDVICTQPAERAVYVVGSDVVATNSATVPNSLLANSSITINSNTVALGGTTTITANTTQTLTRGNYLTGNNFNGSAATTWAVDADTANTAGKVVARDGSGNFAAGTITAARFSGPLTGAVGDVTPTTGTFTVLTATADSAFTSTGALTISKGTTGQQPGTPVTGMLRYNTTTGEFEGYSGASPSWKSVGGSAISNDTSTATDLFPLFAAATTGTAQNIFTSNAQYLFKPSTGELSVKAPRASNGIVVNSATVTSDYTIATGDNGMSAGPVTVASGITVTVSSGSVWTVV